MFTQDGNKEITYNDYVGPIVRKLNRAYVEMSRSLSERTNDITQADQARLTSYINSIDKLITTAAAEPVGDYPISHREMEYPIEALPEADAVVPENEIAELIMNQIRRMRFEVAHGQTSRMPTSVHQNDDTSDLERWRQYLTRMRNLLSQYVSAHKPQDYPATSPSKPVGESPSAGI